MPNTLWALGGLGFVLARILSQMLRRWVALKRQKPCTNSEQPPIYGVGGGLFIDTGQPDQICPKWPWVTKELTRVTIVRFQTHVAAWLGLQVKLTHPTLDKIALIVFAQRHRIWLSITSVTLTLFTWTPLNIVVVLMNQQRRKGNNETAKSSRSIIFTRCLLMS